MATGAFQHYRLSILGRDLQDSLDELISHELFDAEHKDVVLEHFDRAILDALSSQVKAKAVIKGTIKHYRNHDDIWTIILNSIDLKLDGKGVGSDCKTELIAVAKRT